MKTVKTGKIVKYLIGLFAAASVLILAGGAKKMFGSDSKNEESLRVKKAALLYIPAGENGKELCAVAEDSPEFLLYAASSSELKTVEADILE